MNVNDDARWLKALSDDSARVVRYTNTLHTARPNFGFENRITDQHILNFVVSGGFIAEFDGGRHSMLPGSLIWMRPMAPHGFSFLPGESHLQMINFRFSIRKGRSSYGFAKPGYVVNDAGHLRHYSQAMLDDAVSNRSFLEERCKRLLYLLFTDIIEEDPETVGRVFTAGERSRLFAYMHRNYSGRPTPADLARVLGFSSDYFRRVFNRSFNRSPRRWIMEQRIHQAATHLLTGETVSETALALGYRDLYLFSRQFKEVTGVAPSRYASNASRGR